MADDISNSDLLTPEQAARLLQVNRETIYRYVRSGRLPAAWLGRAYRISKRDLQWMLDFETRAVAPGRATTGVAEPRAGYQAWSDEGAALSDGEVQDARATYRALLRRTAGILNTGAPPLSAEELRALAEEAIAAAALEETSG
jgi:excisionase family DNA binding protein